MFLDKHLILATNEDGQITQTRAVCLTQNDLPAPTDGVGPYEGFWLSVLAWEDVTGLEVTLKHCDTKDGVFEELVKFPARDADMGTSIITAPAPHCCKNWLRLTFNKPVAVNAQFTAGVDKNF